MYQQGRETVSLHTQLTLQDGCYWSIPKYTRVLNLRTCPNFCEFPNYTPKDGPNLVGIARQGTENSLIAADSLDRRPPRSG